MRKIGGSETFENLSILDHAGNRMIRMTSICWSDEDRQRLIQWSGVAPVALDGFFTGPALVRKYPEAVPLAERHPLWATLLVLALALAL